MKQGEATKCMLKTKKRILKGQHVKTRDTGAMKRAKRGRDEALEAKVQKEKAAMTPAEEGEEGEEQPATATSTGEARHDLA